MAGEVSDGQVREDLPMKAAGSFPCAECGEHGHTYWAERREHVGKPRAGHQEEQVLHGAGDGVPSRGWTDWQRQMAGAPLEYLSLDLTLLVICKEEQHF